MIVESETGENRTVKCVKKGMSKDEKEPTNFDCKYKCYNDSGATPETTTTPTDLSGKVANLLLQSTNLCFAKFHSYLRRPLLG